MQESDKPSNEPTSDYAPTCSEVLESSIWDLIKLGHKHGMTDDEVDAVLYAILDQRAKAHRGAFKVHEKGPDSD